MSDTLQLFKPRPSQKAALISLFGNPTCRETIVVGKKKAGATTVGIAWSASLLTGERIDAVGLHEQKPVCILALGLNWKYCGQFYRWLFADKKPWIDDHLVEFFQWQQHRERHLREAKLYNGNRLYIRPFKEAAQTNWPVDHVWIDGAVKRSKDYEVLAKLADKKVLWTIGHDHDISINLLRRTLDEDGGRLFHIKDNAEDR